MRSRVRYTLTVVAIAAVAWGSAEWLAASRPSALRGLAAVGCAALLAALASRSHFARLDRLRVTLEDALAGRLSPRIEKGDAGALGALARTVSAVEPALRSRAEEAAAERERLMAVLDGMVEGVLVLGDDGRVLLANARLRDLFHSWGEITGRRPLEVIRVAEVDAALRRAIQDPEPVAIEIESADDRTLAMHAHRFPGKGEVEGVVAVFHDVSEIRRLESHRRDFVANVSHELRTPLTAIRGFAETLQDDALPLEQRKRYLEVIARNAERLEALIDDLLELSRIEGGRYPLVLAAIDPGAVAHSLLRDMRPRLEARRLEAEVTGGPVAALADRRALEQVLQNLIDNAVKYTEPGGRIDVRVASDGARVRIEVADTGIGIPERDRARVFERFYRVDKARSRDLGGTGLGLSIVKHLAQAMEGDVFLTSREGEGSTFTVVLKAAAKATA